MALKDVCQKFVDAIEDLRHEGFEVGVVPPDANGHVDAESFLDGVAERMAEVQDGSPSRLAFVFSNHACLDLAAAAHGVRQRVRILVEQRRHIRLEPVEEVGVSDRAMLDNLRQSGYQLTLGQGIERTGIDEHDLGLVERADQVLALRVIDARLAADGGIDLGQ